MVMRRKSGSRGMHHVEKSEESMKQSRRVQKVELLQYMPGEM
jgi:hypothetical protein